MGLAINTFCPITLEKQKQPALPGTLNYQKCRIGQAVLPEAYFFLRICTSGIATLSKLTLEVCSSLEEFCSSAV